MNKVILYGGVVFSIFIIYSITFQHLTAMDSKDLIIKNPKSDKQNRKIIGGKILEELLIKIKYGYNCDCNQYQSFFNKHPIICSILTPIWIIVALITILITPIMNPPFIYFFIAELGTAFDCWWG